MTTDPAELKAVIQPLRRAMVDFETDKVRAALEAASAPDALFRLSHPIGENVGPDAFFQSAYAPLLDAFPDLERRDYIVMAGADDDGADWVGLGGYYTGVFVAPWLDIPPTGHMASLRFHEFYRIENGKIVEVQALWDIVALMMQAGVWPMVPSLGLEWHVPGPSTLDGVVPAGIDPAQSQASKKLVIDMLEALVRHPSEGGPEVMEMSRYWHPKMSWYGPGGIGTARGSAGFRNWHQIPFLSGMPDRGQHKDGVNLHFFADGDYAAVTGWPNMKQTISADGWLGIAPTGKPVTMKSLDFWRIENGLIRENWVMLDLLDTYLQLGIDVLARLREFNKARSLARIELPENQH